MLRIRFAIAIAFAGMLTAGAGVTYGQAASKGAGQSYPVKSIRIVTTETGAGNDLLARIVAQSIAGPLGQTIIVENRATSASAISQLLNYLLIWFHCIFSGNLNIRTTFACASLRAIGSGNCLSISRVRFTRFSNVLPSCISQRLR